MEEINGDLQGSLLEDVMMLRFAFMLMGPYDPGRDDVMFGDGCTRMIGVPDIETAAQIAKKLADEGYGAIELCGAFGEAGARKIIEATGHSIAVGFVTHFPEDDGLFQKAFGN